MYIITAIINNETDDHIYIYITNCTTTELILHSFSSQIFGISIDHQTMVVLQDRVPHDHMVPIAAGTHITQNVFIHNKLQLSKHLFILGLYKLHTQSNQVI